MAIMFEQVKGKYCWATPNCFPSGEALQMHAGGGKFDYLIIALTATMLSFRSKKIATVSLLSIVANQQAEQQLQSRIWRSFPEAYF